MSSKRTDTKLDLNPPHRRSAEIFDPRAQLIVVSVERRLQMNKDKFERDKRGSYFDFERADNESAAVTRSTVAV